VILTLEISNAFYSIDTRTTERRDKEASLGNIMINVNLPSESRRFSDTSSRAFSERGPSDGAAGLIYGAAKEIFCGRFGRESG
jgi:hypothetical protein